MSMPVSPGSVVAPSLRPLAAAPHPPYAPADARSPERCRPRSDPNRISDDRYRVTNTGDAEHRDVVFGGQFLAQAIVASSLRHPGKDVRSIQAIFARPGRIDAPTELAVDPMHDGRTFASDTVTVWQGDRLCARFMCCSTPTSPTSCATTSRCPACPRRRTRRRRTGGLVYPGTDLRIVDDVDLWSIDAPVGPAETFLWARHRRSPTIPRSTAPCSPGPPTASSSAPRSGRTRDQPGRRAPRPLHRRRRTHDRVPRTVPRRRLAAARARVPVRRSRPVVRASPTCTRTTAASSPRTRRRT